MKLRGKWVTVNSITRFVRDPDPIMPRKARKPRKKKKSGVLRAHDYPLVKSKEVKIRKRFKIAPPRTPGSRKPAENRIRWKELPCDLRSIHIIRHDSLERRRAAGDYDTPKLTAYALHLIADHETPGDLLVNPLPSGCRMKGFQVPLEDSSFIPFYLLGSATAAGNPSRPCDHSGLKPRYEYQLHP